VLGQLLRGRVGLLLLVLGVWAVLIALGVAAIAAVGYG